VILVHGDPVYIAQHLHIAIMLVLVQLVEWKAVDKLNAVAIWIERHLRFRHVALGWGSLVILKLMVTASLKSLPHFTKGVS